MRKILITIVAILCLSMQPYNSAREFHIKMVGKLEVEKFERQHPQVANNRAVYMAYLQKYYRGNENEFILLLKSC